MVTSRTTGPVMGRPSTTRGSRDGEEREDARAHALGVRSLGPLRSTRPASLCDGTIGFVRGWGLRVAPETPVLWKAMRDVRTEPYGMQLPVLWRTEPYDLGCSCVAEEASRLAIGVICAGRNRAL
mmetsp:Transcript_130757/g.184259  ORF Transcript_130757/g.184259 Transcript_130757/m.184259 type:complete len:125 (-) Transcript_130757:163-537(-)